MTRVASVLPLLLAAACGGPSSPPPAAPPVAAQPAPPACGDPIPGSEGLLHPGAVVMFGEIHGTAEIPAFVGRIACAGAARRQPVTVGLEIPRDEQARIDAYLASDGGDAATAAILAGPFWHRAAQDGRSSHGMLALIETVRALRAGGADVRALAYDVAGEYPPDRDARMAHAVLEAHAAAPDRAYVLLSGNIHARRQAGLPPVPEMVPMGVVLLEKVPGYVSFDVKGGPYEYWVCTSDQAADCGVQSSDKVTDPGPVRIDRSAPPVGYDGIFVVGRMTASRPAVP